MRFKLDENLPVDAVAFLIGQGYDASTVFSEQISGIADNELASICQAENRILITLDLDFADIRAYPPLDYPGLIVLRLKQTDIRYVMDFFPKLITLLQIESIQHRLWIVDEERLRIRS
jgi:predicted nuclease of predicted toxin-antitoxin system